MKRKICALFLLLLLPLLLTGCESGEVESSVPSEASVVEESVSEAEPEITWLSLFDSGIESLEAGRYEEAIETFNAAIEMDSHLTGPFKYRAEAYLKLADSAEEAKALEYCRLAAADYETVIGLGVDTADLHRFASNAYYRAADFAKTWEHCSLLLENGETVEDEILIACSEYAGENADIAKLCLQKYFETKDSKYYDAMQACWSTEVLQAYGDFLGLDDEMVFALLDWNMDGVPEIFVSENVGKSVEEPLIWGEYFAYAYFDGEIREIHSGYMDSATYIPSINSKGFLLDHDSGRSGYYGDKFTRMTEDGVVGSYLFEQWREPDGQGGEKIIYQTTPFLASEPTKVSEAEYNEQMSTCTSDLSYELEFISNTPENSLKYLRTDQTQKRQEAEAVLEDLKACIRVLNQCYDFEFGAETDGTGSYYRTVIPGEQPYEYKTSRLYKEGEDSIVLQGNEELDPFSLCYARVANFNSIDEICQYLSGYLAEDIFIKEDSGVYSMRDELSAYFEEVNGELYAFWGGRGYMSGSLDTENVEIIDYDNSTCIARCPYIDIAGKVSGSRQLTFQKGANGWILTEVN